MAGLVTSRWEGRTLGYRHGSHATLPFFPATVFLGEVTGGTQGERMINKGFGARMKGA